MLTEPTNSGEGTGDRAQEARRRLHGLEQRLRTRADEAGGGGHALGKLLEVVQLLNADLDVERVLNLAARQIIDMFEAEQVFLAELSPDRTIRFRLAVNFKGRPIRHPENEVSYAVIRQVADRKEPTLIENAIADPRFARVTSVRNLNLHAVMAAPLMASGALMGVVYADNRSLPGAFSREKLELLGIFANHVAIALRNAQLFHELEAARADLALAERLRTLGQVATFVAHEVRNPLTSLRILVDDLQERWQRKETRERVFRIIPQEVTRLNRAVTRILEYARPTPLIKVPVSLTPLLESALHSLAAQLSKEEVAVTKNVEKDLPLVLADGERLREVFVNLIRNALEAMRASPRKELRLSISPHDERYEEVAIEDSGPGIPEDDLGTIFDPFRSGKETGSGLGLAFCQKVVREHGGRIHAENLSDGGARFRILLPISGT